MRFLPVPHSPLSGRPSPAPPTKYSTRNRQLYFEPGYIPHPFFHESSLPSLSLSSAAVRGAGPLRPSPRSVRRHRSPPTAYELEPARHRGERLSSGVRLSPVHPRDGVPDTAPECLLPLEPLRRCVRPRARVLSMSILCTAAHCQREGKCVEQPSSKYLLTPTGASGARAPAERAAGGEPAGGRSGVVQSERFSIGFREVFGRFSGGFPEVWRGPCGTLFWLLFRSSRTIFALPEALYPVAAYTILKRTRGGAPLYTLPPLSIVPGPRSQTGSALALLTGAAFAPFGAPPLRPPPHKIFNAKSSALF